MRYGFFCLLICVCALVSSCGKESVYEEYKNLPEARWMADSTVNFSFDIADHTKTYDMYYGIRNSAAYPYYNLYVTCELSDPSGKVILNKTLENNLMDPLTGEPFGEGLGDLFDHQFAVATNYKFEKTGMHRMKLRQFMRLDTLPELPAVGIRINYSEKQE